MRRLAALGSLSLSLVACRAHEAQSQKLNDGSWSFTCNLPMEECIRHVEQTCRSQRYRILEGTSEVRVRDVPPLESTYYSSRLHLICDPNGGDAVSSSQKAPPASPTDAPPPLAACTTGETRECVGAGACKGGQSCLPDHSGYSPCDCGAVPRAPDATAPPTTPGPSAP